MRSSSFVFRAASIMIVGIGFGVAAMRPEQQKKQQRYYRWFGRHVGAVV